MWALRVSGSFRARDGQRLNENAPDGVRGSVDTKQRREGHSKVNRFGMPPIRASLKGEAIERERNMSVVSVRGKVIRRDGRAYRKRSGNDHHK